MHVAFLSPHPSLAPAAEYSHGPLYRHSKGGLHRTRLVETVQLEIVVHLATVQPWIPNRLRDCLCQNLSRICDCNRENTAILAGIVHDVVIDQLVR